MCEWGTDELVRVKIAAHLSHSGEPREAWAGIDACIAPLVRALQASGIDMLASCCGHGRAQGRIDLADGRVLLIESPASGTVSASSAPPKEPMEQNERERLHAIIADCNSVIDPERYPELNARIDAVLLPCDEVGHCVAPPDDPEAHPREDEPGRG